MTFDDLTSEVFVAESARLAVLFVDAVAAQDPLAIAAAIDAVRAAETPFGGLCVYTCGVWQSIALRCLDEMREVVDMFPGCEVTLAAEISDAPPMVQRGYELAERALSPEPFLTVEEDAHSDGSVGALTLALTTTLVGLRDQWARLRGAVLS